MDRQPLTDRLGDRLLAEYGGAAAAYSLRALNGNGDSVVRVRRASDNDEKDFTASQVSSGEMVNWVNSQTVPPLDIGVETSEGRIPVPEGGTSIGTPAAAYSLRNLSTTYTGNVVDVRRSSDDAEASFTAAEVSDGTLEDWVNADVISSGYVSKWYDQSGNDNHAVQTTPANQPLIAQNGSLVTGGIDFDGVDDTLVTDSPVITDTFSAAMVSYEETVATGGAFFSQHQNSAANRFSFSQSPTGGKYRFFKDGASPSVIDSTTNIATDTKLSFITKSGVAVGMYFNGGTNEGGNLGSSDILSAKLSIAAADEGGNAFRATAIKELIIYPSDQSDNRTAIEANIGETYGITGIPAYDNTVDGFVETWYDQSGNGNDATQSVAASQPKIVDAGVLVSGGIEFDGVDDRMTLTQPFSGTSARSLFCNVNADTTSINESIFALTSGIDSGAGTAWNFSAETAIRLNGAKVWTSNPMTMPSIGTIILGAGQTINDHNFYLNGSLKTADSSSMGSTSVNTDSTSNSFIGVSNTETAFFDGKIAELIIYDSDQSANRTAIEGNINDHYSIYA